MAKKLIANNKKAYHDYFIEEKYEAGISLAGTEVKSLRMGRCSIKEAFIRIEHDEVFVYNMKKEISLTKIHCACVNYCCIARKSARSKDILRRRVIRSCR